MSEERIGRLEGLVADLAAAHGRMAGTLSLIRESQDRIERAMERDDVAVRLARIESWRKDHERTQDRRWQVTITIVSIVAGAMATKIMGFWGG